MAVFGLSATHLAIPGTAATLALIALSFGQSATAASQAAWLSK